MRGAWGTIGVAAVILIASLVLEPEATVAGSKGSTLTGVWGELRDLQLDPARNRLYASITGRFSTQGVVVIDLSTQQETARVPIPEASGLALSPDGRKLAVGSTDGGLYIVDLDSLTVTGQVFLMDPPYAAAVWDVAFDGRNRVVATLVSQLITCCVPVIVVNITSMREESRIDGISEEISPGSSVNIDSTRERLYVTGGAAVRMYDLTTSPPTRMNYVIDGNFTTSPKLSSDGLRFYFSSGTAYNALTLGFIEEIGQTGDIFLNESGDRIYFAHDCFLEVVSLSTHARIARYAFDGGLAPHGELIGTVTVDAAHGTAYVTTGTIYEDRSLRAVPLMNAITDPYPWDGALWTSELNGFWAILSGDVDPADAHVFLDGIELDSFLDPNRSAFGHIQPTPIADGLHTALITAIDGMGQNLQLEWQFVVSVSGPEVLFDPHELLYTTPSATITGRVISWFPVTAWLNGANLTLDPVTGAFYYTMSLAEGANLVSVLATDSGGRQGYGDVALLRLTSTTRYVNHDARFSISYPPSWMTSSDVTIQGVKVDALIQAPSSIGGAMNLNVIRGGPQPSYTQEYLLQQAQQALSRLTQSPGVYVVDPPANVSIPGVSAVTYSFTSLVASGSVYQRQYLAANADARESWVLTFTCTGLRAAVCDAYSKWMASTFAVEEPDAGRLLVFIVAGAVAGAIAASAAVILLRRKRARTHLHPPMETLPVLQGTPGEAPWVSPAEPSPQQSPREPPKSG